MQVILATQPEAAVEPALDSDPLRAQALGLLPAPRGRRAAAFAIDAALWAALLTPGLFAVPALIELLTGGRNALPVVSLVLLIIGGALASITSIVQLAVLGRRGVTAGKAAMGLRAISVTTLERTGFLRMLLRALIVGASASIVPIAGAVPFLLSPSWDPELRGRGWHDRAVGAWLIDVRSGLDPFDAKALRAAKRRVDTPPPADATGLPSLASESVADEPFVPGPRLSSAVVGGPTAGTVAVESVVPPEAAVPANVAGPMPQAVPSAPGTPPTAVITFDDGSRYRLSGTGLVGRDPVPAEGEAAGGLLAVPDTTSSMSKTHAAYGIDELGFWIADRGSTNGTEIRDQQGSVTIATPGEQTRVPWDATVRLGDRYFIVNRA